MYDVHMSVCVRATVQLCLQENNGSKCKFVVLCVLPQNFILTNYENKKTKIWNDEPFEHSTGCPSDINAEINWCLSHEQNKKSNINNN